MSQDINYFDIDVQIPGQMSSIKLDGEYSVKDPKLIIDAMFLIEGNDENNH